MLDSFCLTYDRKKFERCVFIFVTRLVTLQNQSSLRLVKVLTGEFIGETLVASSYLGHWNGTVGF